MSLPQAVAAYVEARLAADSAPVWARLMQEGIVCARMQELLAACYAANETLADALIDHAPEYVRQQTQRWQEMAARIEPAKKPKPIVVLGPWQGEGVARMRRGSMPGAYPIVWVGSTGWTVRAHGDLFAEIGAHGPQTGPEGERLAMAAALALGFVEGAQ